MQKQQIIDIRDNMNKEWKNILFSKENVSKFTQSLNQVRALNIPDTTICPSYSNILRAFNFFEPKDLRVVIIGQDPYPNTKEACGLSFSTGNKAISGSLRNINIAITKTYPEQVLTTGCLEHWVKQGVLLLNRSLTTIHGKSNVHADIWKPYTNYLVELIDNLDNKVIFVLWGNNAKEVIPLIKKSKYVTWRHPSPMANINVQLSEMFSNCNSFRLVNEFIRENNLGNEIVWGDKIIEILSNKENITNIVDEIISDTTIIQREYEDPFAETTIDTNFVDIDLPDSTPQVIIEQKVINNIKLWIPINTKICLPENTIIFTDGSASNNGRSNAIASYAFIIKYGTNAGYIQSGEVAKLPDYNPSNNRGELLGVLNSLQYVLDNNINTNIIIICDSEYTVKMYNSWLDKWIKEDSINTKANQDLIQKMIDIKTEIIKKNINVNLSHVESHTTEPINKTDDKYFIWQGNEEVDLLATKITNDLLKTNDSKPKRVYKPRIKKI